MRHCEDADSYRHATKQSRNTLVRINLSTTFQDCFAKPRNDDMLYLNIF